MAARYVTYCAQASMFFRTYPRKYNDIEGSRWTYLAGPDAPQRDYAAKDHFRPWTGRGGPGPRPDLPCVAGEQATR